MTENKGVNSDSPTENPDTESVSEDEKTPVQQPEVKREPVAGDNMIPYSRFKEKVDRVKELEEKLKEQESLSSSEQLSNKYPDWDYLDDNQKAIIKRQEVLEKELKELKEKDAFKSNLSKVFSEFPEIQSEESEFQEYCSQNPQVDVGVLAKSFLFDKKPKRKGLEAPTGGDKKAVESGMTIEEVKRIRETDEKLFRKLIQEGRIDVKKLK